MWQVPFWPFTKRPMIFKPTWVAWYINGLWNSSGSIQNLDILSPQDQGCWMRDLCIFFPFFCWVFLASFQNAIMPRQCSHELDIFRAKRIFISVYWLGGSLCDFFPKKVHSILYVCVRVCVCAQGWGVLLFALLCIDCFILALFSVEVRYWIS